MTARQWGRSDAACGGPDPAGPERQDLAASGDRARGRVVHDRGRGGPSGDVRDRGGPTVQRRNPADRVWDPAHRGERLRKPRIRIRVCVRAGQPVRDGRPSADAAGRTLEVLRRDGGHQRSLRRRRHQPPQGTRTPELLVMSRAHRACGSPAHGSPTSFTGWQTQAWVSLFR